MAPRMNGTDLHLGMILGELRRDITDILQQTAVTRQRLDQAILLLGNIPQHKPPPPEHQAKDEAARVLGRLGLELWELAKPRLWNLVAVLAAFVVPRLLSGSWPSLTELARSVFGAGG